MNVIKSRKLARVKKIVFSYAVRVNAKDEIGYDYFEVPVGQMEELIYELAGYKLK